MIASPRARAPRPTRSVVGCLFVVAMVGSCVGGPAPEREGASLAEPTAASDALARSFYLSNWQDTFALWKAARLAPNDPGGRGPRIDELRLLEDPSTGVFSENQISDWGSYFRDETNARQYTATAGFHTRAYLDEGGILRTEYLKYGGRYLDEDSGVAEVPLAVQVHKDFAMVPGQRFLVARYELTNAGATDVTWNVLDQVHVKNRGGADHRAAREAIAGRSALLVDMTSTGQYAVGLAAFDAAAGFQVANDGVGDVSAPAVSPWSAFAASGTLPGNAQVTARDISVGLSQRVSIPAHGSTTVSFVVVLDRTVEGARAALSTALSHSAAEWFETTRGRYAAWLAGGQTVHFDDEGLNLAYRRALVSIKQTIHPRLGFTPAATNPFDDFHYGYKVWVRDSVVTSMILDMAGFVDDTANYWPWIASKQLPDGDFKTRYIFWTNEYNAFAEPEHDAVGLFLLAAYQHYRVLAERDPSEAREFLDQIWEPYRKSADFVANRMHPDGWGPSDCSIWEESQQHYAFTQGLYATGLGAAQYLAEARHDTGAADRWNWAASWIRSSIQRGSDWNPQGLWNASAGYYHEAAGNPRTDSATNALIVYGVVDALSSRASSHMAQIGRELRHDGWGIARYDGDRWYQREDSPGGFEAGSDEPTWPQMSAYVGLYHVHRGERQWALDYLRWLVARTASGYVPQGEAVSRVGRTFPLLSTLYEPVTAAWYVATALSYEGKLDLRLTPPRSEAGAYKTVRVTTDPSADLGQWFDVPYYRDPAGDAVSGGRETDIARVYLANDDHNLYVRVKNVGGSLPAFGSPRFAVMLYGRGDASSGAETATGYYGAALSRPARVLFTRWNDTNGLQRLSPQGNGGWGVQESAVPGVIEPQWITSTGDIEMVVPLAELGFSDGDAAAADLEVALARAEASSNVWREDDTASIRYHRMKPGQAWFYGDVE